jgi:hypothetical protein
MKSTVFRYCPILSCAAFVLFTGQPVLAASADDACSLLTPAQVTAALTVPVDQGKALGGGKSCQWRQPAAKPGDAVFILDISLISMNAFNVGKSIGSGSPGGRAPTATPVTGIGDDAYYYTLGKITELRLKKGAAFVAVRVWGGTRPLDEYQAKDKTVAQAILPKM